MSKVVVAAVASALLMSGAHAVADAATRGDTANFSFRKEFSVRDSSTPSSTYFLSGAECANPKKVAKISKRSEDQASAAALAGSTMITVKSSQFVPAGVVMGSGPGVGATVVREQNCAYSAAFSTEAGHDYEVIDRMEPNGACRIRIRDLTDGSTPKWLRFYDHLDCTVRNPKKRDWS